MAVSLLGRDADRLGDYDVLVGFQFEDFGDGIAIDRGVHHNTETLRSTVQVDVLGDQTGIDTGCNIAGIFHFVVVGNEDNDPVSVFGKLLCADLAAEIARGYGFESMFRSVVEVGSLFADQVEVDLLAVHGGGGGTAAIRAVDAPRGPQHVGELLLGEGFFRIEGTICSSCGEGFHQGFTACFLRSGQRYLFVLRHGAEGQQQRAETGQSDFHGSLFLMTFYTKLHENLQKASGDWRQAAFRLPK